MGITVGVVLARGGSKGVLRKNLRPLLGKPLVAYTLETAKRARRIDRLVLSTEDEEIATVARSHAVEVIMRPPEYATDEAPMDDALRHVVGVLEGQGVSVSYVVALYGNIPVRKDDIIDRVIGKLNDTGADSVMTYAEFRKPPQWAFLIQDDAPVPLAGVHRKSYRRQELPPAYYPDGAVVAIRRGPLMAAAGSPDHAAFLGKDRRAVTQSPNDTVDVDEEFDILWAEFLLSKGARKAFSEGSESS